MARAAPEPSPARRLLREMVRLVALPLPAQERLDRLVATIARHLVAEVCSLYVLRAGDVLELFATEGLSREAVHVTRLAVGEGLVGTIAAEGIVIATSDAQSDPRFVYRPETHEERYSSFLGVPVVRSGRVVGVLTVQNEKPRTYGEDEIEALTVVASVVAEMLASGDILDPSRYADAAGRPLQPRRLEGVRLVGGIAVGRAWTYAPRIDPARLLAEDPAAERERLDRALAELRASLERAFARHQLGGEGREIVEVYRAFTEDAGWRRRIEEAIATGLAAEAAVRRVRDETRLRLGHASDPYLRERLVELDELAERLLFHLSGRDPVAEAAALPEDSVIVARNLSAAQLLQFDRRRVRAIVLEEGSPTSHAAILARALGIPVVGLCRGAMLEIEEGDVVAVDAERGQVFVRPGEALLEAFRRAEENRLQRARALEALRPLPAVSRDGVRVRVEINAGFLVDVEDLAASGADGCGLFRTELLFMESDAWPDRERQAAFYRAVLERAGDLPVTFRTVDIGSDKPVAWLHPPPEANPALGWRGVRLALDRPRILRTQLAALLEAGAGRRLRVMFPMVAHVEEYRRAAALLDEELKRRRAAGLGLPAALERGVMFEVPALFWQLDRLLPLVDFVSVGSNDLLQFLFAFDRSSPVLAQRYDVLAPPALRCLRDLAERCAAAGVRLSVCGEMASQPLEAMALVGVGVRCLSVAPTELLPVKAMIRSLDVGSLAGFLERALAWPVCSLREALAGYAADHGVVLPPPVRPVAAA
ncbi:Phosphoenolpyruvate-dependent phosphotransferase system [bacterium HR39]|nr:Phosphoenolpyruvate-dependent phosphotransferase system [bacterium HR39]